VPFQVVIVIAAILAFVILALIRLDRVRSHRETFTSGQQAVFVAAFLLVPPIVLQTLLNPKGVDAASATILYIGVVIVIWVLESVAGLLVARFAPEHRRQMLLMALIGRDTSGFVPFDPPLTEQLAADVTAVDRANAAFSRGTGFLAETHRAGFAADWQALDEATRALESGIAEQRRLRLGVSEQAIDVAADARGRLDTLRREAPTTVGLGAGNVAGAG
jgi:hypothetical protein